MDFAFATFVLKMKGIVMIMMSVKMVLFVDQTIVLHHLVLSLKLIVAIHARIPVVILTGKVTTFAMMKTTIVDVIGMEETVVVVMLTQITAITVNV